ncbi:WD40-repeat-containing domain protein, partial [Dendryphion nanum]
MTASNLLIITPSTILLHSQSSQHQLFTCSPESGILNARAAPDNSGLLAIADNHLVILYDTNQGKDKKYTLRSGDGDPRMLLFSPDSKMLYFTTTLSPSIQVYCIPDNTLLSPLLPHPSPPTVLCLSEFGDVLLSASPKPPTISIFDLRLPGTAPIRVVPSHTRSPVNCAMFQQSNNDDGAGSYIFALGFQDGSLGVYNLVMPRLSLYQAPQLMDPDLLTPIHVRRPKKLACVSRLHKASMRGIMAVAFLPGHPSRMRVLGMPTSLAVTASAPVRSRGRRDKDVILNGDVPNDEEEDEVLNEATEVLIAVGLQTGQVLVFNILGLLIRELEGGKASIVNVQWVRNMQQPTILPKRRPSAIGDGLMTLKQSVLDMMIGDNSGLELENTDGTVQRNPSSPSRGGSSNAIPSIRAKDLFSSGQESMGPIPKRHLSRIYPLDPRKLSNGTPTPPIPPRSLKRPRRSFTRPRIVTETFKTP